MDFFSRIASINDWTAENRLNAFPLYLSGIAQAWFLSLREDQQKDLTQIQAAFKERFASGPQNWIISQQLSTRKQVQGERINDYSADITRLCKRLKLSDADSIHYFIQGLQQHIQSYVTLARPKDFQEAESLTRMKELVDINQSASDTKSVLSQMEAMFTKLMTQSKATNPQTIAAVSTESTQPQLDKRLDELNRQIKQLQKHTQQFPAPNSNIAAITQPENAEAQRFSQMRNWSGQPNRQIDQMQRQINRLESELRRYQNPRRLDFRSYGRSFRTVEGDPVCSFCHRIGHTWRNCHQRNRAPRLPPTQGNGPPRTQFSGRTNSREQHPPLNG